MNPERTDTPSSPDSLRVEEKSVAAEQGALPDPIGERLRQYGYDEEDIARVVAAIGVLEDDGLLWNSPVSDPYSEHTLAAEFGGDDRVRVLRVQLSAWAEQFLPAGLVRVLLGSQVGFRGVFRMLAEASGPDFAIAGSAPSPVPDVAQLKRMMQDQRYWSGDETLHRQVRMGFESLYKKP